MKDVADIVAEHARNSEVVVVVSAMGGVTDMLIRAANEASQGDREHWKNVRRELARRHREVADQLLPAAEQARCAAAPSRASGEILKTSARGSRWSARLLLAPWTRSPAWAR